MMEMTLRSCLHEASMSSMLRDITVCAGADPDEAASVNLPQDMIEALSRKILFLPHEGVCVLLARYCFELSCADTERFYGMADAKGRFRFYRKLLSSCMGLGEKELISDASLKEACGIVMNEYLKDEAAEAPETEDTGKVVPMRGGRLFRKIGRIAAVIVLTCVLSLGVLMAVSPTVRAAVLHWIETWYEEYVSYSFTAKRSDDPDAPMPRYEVADFPEGFVQFNDEYESGGLYDIGFYQEDTGRMFTFVYMRMEYGKTLMMDHDEGDAVLEVTVNGMHGRINQSASEEPDGSILWVDEDQNLLFTISGPFTNDELMRLAESVRLVEKPLELAQYGVTSFPNGMVGTVEGKYTLLREKQVMYVVDDPLDEDRISSLCFYFARLSDTGRILSADSLPPDISSEDVTVNGCPSRFFWDSWANDTTLIWSDDESGMWFSLNGIFTKEEMLLMAESVTTIEP